MILLIQLWLVSQVAFSITNSVPAESSDFESVVFIKTESRDPQDNSDAPSFCGATLLSPDLMITAGHCVKDAYALKRPGIQIQVGKYRYFKKPDGSIVRTGYAPYLDLKINGKFYFVPEVKTQIDRNGTRTQLSPASDMAVVVLDQPLTLRQDFPYAAIASNQELNSAARQWQSSNPTVVSHNLNEIQTTNIKRMGQLNQLSMNSGYLESKSFSRVESGDSGSPLFVSVGKALKLIAVVKGLAQTWASSWDVYSLVSQGQKVCRVADQLASLGHRNTLCPTATVLADERDFNISVDPLDISIQNEMIRFGDEVMDVDSDLR